MFDEDDLTMSSDSEPSPPPQDEEEHTEAGSGVKIEKRHYHNLLERNRRNILKYSFAKLRNAIPTFAKRNARASRAKILRRSIEFIRRSEQKRAAREKDVKDMRAENKILEDQIRAMESVTESTSVNALQLLLHKVNETTYKEHTEEPSDTEEEESDDSDEANEENENDPDAGYSDDDDIGDQNRAPEPQVIYPVNVPASESETEDSTDSDSSD